MCYVHTAVRNRSCFYRCFVVSRNVNMDVLIVEPFYGGAHRQLLDTVFRDTDNKLHLFSMTSKKWHWRARVSALHFSQDIPKGKYDVLITSSVLNLCELMGLRPDLREIPRTVIYFHENQLVYPRQTVKERDFQYGYNQINSGLTADVLVFNSTYNMNSFLSSISTFLKMIPDYRPDSSRIVNELMSKSLVLHFPLSEDLFEFQPELILQNRNDRRSSMKPLHILWNHRWEHDKNPEEFIATLEVLHSELGEKHHFEVSFLGETFSEVPKCFERIKNGSLPVKNFGFVPSREKYLEILSDCDVVVSTALHEFFGVAVAEAVARGCIPLVPNRLVYPEIYSSEFLYGTVDQMKDVLQSMIVDPISVRNRSGPSMDRFRWKNLKQKYREILFGETVNHRLTT